MTLEKTVAQSRTEQIQILMKGDMNGYSRLFGGKLMEWIDVAAAVAARRHSGRNVTTACIDSLVFRAPAHANDTLVLIAQLTYVGKSSMEVRVDSYVEKLDGARTLINTASLVLVALDEAERPAPVPRLIPETEEEKRELAAGAARAALRRQRQAEL